MNTTLPSSDVPQKAPMAHGGESSRAGDLIFLPVALTALWTLAYQIVLITRLPAWTIVVLFLGISLAGAWAARRFLRRMPWEDYEFHRSDLFLLILGIGCGVTVLFVLRPNQDDIVYFHRAFVQLAHLSEPILTRQTSVDVDAAAFSPVHLATSHEMLMALLGHFLGGDPLYFYQVVGHVLAAFGIPFVFYFCGRCFRVKRTLAAAGAACVILFLLIDDSGSAAFGSTAFARMWQGKAVVWVLSIPMAICLTYRFMRVGDRRDILWLTLLALSGVGLSNSALYLIPAAVGSAGLASLALNLWEEKEVTSFLALFKRSILLAIPLIYPVGILFLLAVNIIPKPVDRHGFGPEFIPWWKGVEYVVGRTPFLWRDIVLILAVPCLIVGRKRGRFLILYAGLIFLLCLNPLLAHFWMKNITAACYFRLVYLMPLPLLIVFLPVAFWRDPERSRKNLGFVSGIIGVAAIVVSTAFSFRSLTVSPGSQTLRWKSPLDYQILPDNIKFARAAAQYLAHGKLLAPAWTASCELPLLFPEMKVVAPRLATHYFANAGARKEGSLRRMAQAFVEGENTGDGRRKAALLQSFKKVVTSSRVTAIAAPRAESQRVLATLHAIDPRWHLELEAGGLVLLLPPAGAPPAANR